MLNVPRDTEAPGGGKINAFHSNGGLPAFVDQINKMMGIQVNYAITTDFPRFIHMVNEIGGIKIDIPYDLTDHENSGADFRPGPTKVNGDQALSISRDRHDFDRQGDRQRTYDSGLVILSALKTLQQNQSSAADTVRLLALLMPGITTKDVSMGELFRLGRLAMTIDPPTSRTARSRQAPVPVRTSRSRPMPNRSSPTSATTAWSQGASRCLEASTPRAPAAEHKRHRNRDARSGTAPSARSVGSGTFDSVAARPLRRSKEVRAGSREEAPDDGH